MEKQVLAIAVFVLACSLPSIADSSRGFDDPSFDIYELSLQFGKRRGQFDYYKLSLEWPQSVCNTGDQCETPIPPNFTIHTLQPYYKPDNRVPPFNQSSCNAIPPIPADDITAEYLYEHGLLEDMVKYWPNLFAYSNITANLEFWRLQWTRAGMCSPYPIYPKFYFNVPLVYIKAIDLKKILGDAGIYPNDQKYEASAFTSAIDEALGLRTQIRCKKNAENTTQFYEAFICIDKLNFPMSCPKTKYYSCGSATEKILFPAPGREPRA